MISVNMDWNNYYNEQIDKSKNYTLNKVSDFSGNQTGGFIKPLGKFLWNQVGNFAKWRDPEGFKQLQEESKGKYDKLAELSRKIQKAREQKAAKEKIIEQKASENVEEQEGGGLIGALNPFLLHYYPMKGVENIHNFVKDN